jgi:ParB family chromosome partitioning protein
MNTQSFSGDTATLTTGTASVTPISILLNEQNTKESEAEELDLAPVELQSDYEELINLQKEQLLDLQTENPVHVISVEVLQDEPTEVASNALVKWDEIEKQIDIQRDISVLVKYHAVLGNKEFRKQLDGSTRSINKCEKYKIKVEMAFGDYYKKLDKKSGRPEKSVNPIDELSPKQLAEQEIGKSRETISKYMELSNIKSRDKILEKYESICNDKGLEMSSAGLLNFAINKKINLKEHNTGNNEWYSPEPIIEKTRIVMGSIDCDPASCDLANEIVKAIIYFTVETDGLDKSWNGNVYMNPPYARGKIELFTNKLEEEIKSGNTKQAVVVTNSDTDTVWYHKLLRMSDAICLTKGRIKFYNEKGIGEPLCGQTIFYIGDNVEKFIQHFSDIGYTIKLHESPEKNV